MFPGRLIAAEGTSSCTRMMFPLLFSTAAFSSEVIAWCSEAKFSRVWCWRDVRGAQRLPLRSVVEEAITCGSRPNTFWYVIYENVDTHPEKMMNLKRPRFTVERSSLWPGAEGRSLMILLLVTTPATNLKHHMVTVVYDCSRHFQTDWKQETISCSVVPRVDFLLCSSYNYCGH